MGQGALFPGDDDNPHLSVVRVQEAIMMMRCWIKVGLRLRFFCASLPALASAPEWSEEAETASGSH